MRRVNPLCSSARAYQPADLHLQVEVLPFVPAQARQKGLIVLVAIHDLNQALRYADKVLLIADGRMRACAGPLEVINSAMLHEIYQVKARIEKFARLSSVPEIVAPIR